MNSEINLSVREITQNSKANLQQPCSTNEKTQVCKITNISDRTESGRNSENNDVYFLQNSNIGVAKPNTSPSSSPVDNSLFGSAKKWQTSQSLQRTTSYQQQQQQQQEKSEASEQGLKPEDSQFVSTEVNVQQKPMKKRKYKEGSLVRSRRCKGSLMSATYQKELALCRNLLKWIRQPGVTPSSVMPNDELVGSFSWEHVCSSQLGRSDCKRYKTERKSC